MTQTKLLCFSVALAGFLYAGCSSSNSSQAVQGLDTAPPIAVTPAPEPEPVLEPEPVADVVPEPEPAPVEIVASEPVVLPAPAVKDPEALTILGFIKYVELEGGFFGITTETGTKYFPEYLEQDFKVDGLKVRVVAKPQKQILGIQMWGTPIKILKIEAD